MDEAEIQRPRGKNTRWAISSLLCTMIILNYFDRVAIAAAAPELQSSFNLSATEIGLVFSIYNYAYTMMQLPIGPMLDRWGVFWITRIGMAVWSVLTILFAFVSGKLLLYVLRFLTGIMSASAFPAASKATANWFPFHERGLASSLFDSAAKFSNVLGGPLVALMITFYGWRAAFILIGVINVLFTVIFWRYYDEPGRHKKISEEEVNYIQKYGADSPDLSVNRAKPMWKKLFTSRKVWGVTIGFTGYGYTFNLLLLWLPTFFKKEFQTDLLTSSLLTAVPWLIASISGVAVGGLLTDRLIRKGHPPDKVYKTIIVTGMSIGFTFLGALLTSNPVLSMVYISIGLAGISATAPIGWIIASKISPPGAQAQMSSIVNFSNNLFGGIIAAALTGYIVDKTGSFDYSFIIAAVVLAAGLFFYTFVLGDIKMVETEEK
ncbi:MFS transporter [Bacillus mangrovi]|uniref:MFS transporter n=1 Tax=Metabacillus mangrovi TaxID=1491830 RepID=A0A7X2S1C0_9BACI|nr:MFS transporter [Metabacillus mangrovi]MTH51964.1 MFS transporter [Metabacillus mangrovi]